MPWTSAGAVAWMPSLTWQCSREIDRVLNGLPAGARIVDLGSGGRQLSPATICVDFVAFPNTSVVADVHNLPFCDASIDAVFATGLLEHIDDPSALMNEIVRVLRPGGILHIEVPFMQQYHEDPVDYRRYTIPGLRRELERHGFTTDRAGFHIGPTVAIITLLTYYAAMWFNGRSFLRKLLSTGVFFAVSVVLWPLRYLDAIAKRCADAHRLCFGVYCTAAKPHGGRG